MTAFRLDSELRFTDQTVRSSYSYAAVYRLGPFTIRVRLRSAATRRESLAVAEVLSTALTWTVLVDAEPPARQPGETEPAKVSALADELMARAARILLGVGEAQP